MKFLTVNQMFSVIFFLEYFVADYFACSRFDYLKNYYTMFVTYSIVIIISNILKSKI